MSSTSRLASASLLVCIACDRPEEPPRPPASEPAAAPQAAPRGVVPTTRPPAAVEPLLAEIDPARLRVTVDRLAGFGTRHTLSSVDDPERGIGAARNYLAATLREQGDPRLHVALDPHRIEPDGRRVTAPVDVVNVVATLPGSLPEAAGRRYYVIGHYDSRASDVMDPDAEAPGANDDASGVAVVVELARVLGRARLDATVVFMATAGEEQGLLGADRHAKAAAAAGLDVRAVLNNDIVGDPLDDAGQRDAGRIRLFSTGIDPWISEQRLQELRALGATEDASSRQLARFVGMVARWHQLPVQPVLVFRPDRFLRGGDHSAFNAAGFAAVRFTETAENYDRQHQDPRVEAGRTYGDDPRFVDPEYLAGVARLNAAALIHLANAPSPPRARLIATGLTTDTTVRWDPSPEPDVAGYEVVWRTTTSPDWEHVRDLAQAREATLPLSKDDWHFGVRAYDRDGYRSPVAYPEVER